jgi:hypothetical protein
MIQPNPTIPISTAVSSGAPASGTFYDQVRNLVMPRIEVAEIPAATKPVAIESVPTSANTLPTTVIPQIMPIFDSTSSSTSQVLPTQPTEPTNTSITANISLRPINPNPTDMSNRDWCCRRSKAPSRRLRKRMKARRREVKRIMLVANERSRMVFAQFVGSLPE